MILIADSGSTKCDWVLLTKNNSGRRRSFRTVGLNPSTMKKSEMFAVLNCSEYVLECKERVKAIYFFGAGCNNAKAVALLNSLFAELFPMMETCVVQEDLMIAIHATSSCAGVVGILGTGSNCCFFNGLDVEHRVRAMGYLLMDEGSGNHLGKELLRSYFYGKLPTDLKIDFERVYSLQESELITGLYSGNRPSAYLASIGRFLIEHLEHPYAKQLVQHCMREFVENQLLVYKEELKDHPLFIIGSVGYYARKVLKELLEEKRIRVKTTFIRRPLDVFVQGVLNDVTLLDAIAS